MYLYRKSFFLHDLSVSNRLGESLFKTNWSSDEFKLTCQLCKTSLKQWWTYKGFLSNDLKLFSNHFVNLCTIIETMMTVEGSSVFCFLFFFFSSKQNHRNIMMLINVWIYCRLWHHELWQLFLLSHNKSFSKAFFYNYFFLQTPPFECTGQLTILFLDMWV